MAAVVVPAAAAVAAVGAAAGGGGSSGSSEDLSFKSGGHGGGSAASKVAAFKSLHYHYQGQKSQHKLPRGNAASAKQQQAQQLPHGRRHHFHRHISADYLSEVDAGRRCNR